MSSQREISTPEAIIQDALQRILAKVEKYENLSNQKRMILSISMRLLADRLDQPVQPVRVDKRGCPDCKERMLVVMNTPENDLPPSE